MATKRVTVESIGSYFESLTDPRHTRNRKHLFIDIVVIAVCGLVCGCDGPTAIHRWATNRRDWLNGFLSRPNGLPSHDRSLWLFSSIDTVALEQACSQWLYGVAVVFLIM